MKLMTAVEIPSLEHPIGLHHRVAFIGSCFAPDLLHPSEQAVDYIWERFSNRWLDAEARRYLVDYEPIRKLFQHRPDDPDSPATRRFREQAQERLRELMTKYHLEL